MQEGQAEPVLVIGGGCAGSVISKELTKAGVRVVLVEPREQFWVPYGGVRAYVDAEYGASCLAPYNVEHVRERVTGVDAAAKSVALASGDSLSYSVCVLATGSRYRAPFKFESGSVEEISAVLRETAGRLEGLEEGQHVVVVGGGPVGVETCVEVKVRHPHLRVTLVHSGAELCPGGGNARFRARLPDLVRGLGVEVVLNTRYELDASLPSEEGVLFGDFPMDAHCLIRCLGARPNSQGFAQLAREDGYVAVDAHFRVGGNAHLFACGDVCALPTPSPKLGYIAARYHAPVVIKNVLSTLKGASHLKSYRGPMLDAFGVSLGPEHSSFSLGPLTLNDKLPKEKDLFRGRTIEEST